MGNTAKFIIIAFILFVALGFLAFLLGQYVKTYNDNQYKVGYEKGVSEATTELYSKGITDELQKIVSDIKEKGYSAITIVSGNESGVLVLVPFVPK